MGPYLLDKKNGPSQPFEHKAKLVWSQISSSEVRGSSLTLSTTQISLMLNVVVTTSSPKSHLHTDTLLPLIFGPL